MASTVGDVSVHAWKPAIAGIREVLHATFAHAYPPHTHDAWTLFIVDEGQVRYGLDGRGRGAEPAMVSLLPPFVVHDGRPGPAGRYRKRVIYLEPEVLGEGLIGPAVDRPEVGGAVRRRDVANLHAALGCIDDRLEAETRLAFLVERLRAGYGLPRPAAPERPDHLAEGLRVLLDQSGPSSMTMAAASMTLGASPTQLARAFVRAFGITPHAYLVTRRLDVARRQILDGEPLADVAAATGFYDQAHLTRQFRRFLGVTPGRFAKGPRAAAGD
jgi:AraC-like DNA-binding protein